MPQLPNAASKTQKYFLPSTIDQAEEDRAWVELKLGKVLAIDMINISDPDNKLGLSLELLTNRIHDWNFTEENGTPTAINLDNVSRMELDDITYLLEQLTSSIGTEAPALTTDQKKSS